MNNLETTRITITLPIAFIDELKMLAKTKQVPSLNYAIREAVDDYLVLTRKKQYFEMMKEASKDERFLNRTSKCDKDFAFIDSEVQSEW